MRIIVTGAAGFIGSHVAEHLVSRGGEVLGVDDLSGGFLSNLPVGMQFEKCSVTSPLDDLFRVFQPEVVIHLAAYAAEGLSHHIPVFNYQNNLVGTANVLAAAYRNGVRHFVFTSSIAVYGHLEGSDRFDEDSPCHPCDPYGIAKLACEQHIRAFSSYYGAPSFTIFRPHNVFGPRQNVSDPYRNVVGIFMKKALEKAAMPVFGDGLQTRSFSYIDSVARCIADAAFEPNACNSVYNVGADEAMSVMELARRIAVAFGVAESIQMLPSRKEVQHAHSSHEKARRAFPAAFESEVDIATGIELMARYVREREVPNATECPSPIEIPDLLPPSWAQRLGVLPTFQD